MSDYKKLRDIASKASAELSRCAACNRPENDHNVRHQFVGAKLPTAEFRAAFHPAQCIALLDENAKLRALLRESVNIGRAVLASEGYDFDECASWARLAAIRTAGGIADE